MGCFLICLHVVQQKANDFNCWMNDCRYFILFYLRICYDINMETTYFRTKTTVSFINYHFVFCPKYRRKIFLIPRVEERFKELTRQKCEELNIEILTMECHIDHVHLFLKCWPTQSPAEIMKEIKGASSHVLRNEFPKLKGMSSLWTRSYFVSTADNVSSDTIKWYIDTQKTRG